MDLYSLLFAFVLSAAFAGLLARLISPPPPPPPDAVAQISAGGRRREKVIYEKPAEGEAVERIIEVDAAASCRNNGFEESDVHHEAVVGMDRDEGMKARGLGDSSDVISGSIEAGNMIKRDDDVEYRYAQTVGVNADDKGRGEVAGEEMEGVDDGMGMGEESCSANGLASEFLAGELTLPQVLQLGSSDGDEDEWEGIEMSEVEKRFGNAMAFNASENGAEAVSQLSSDVQFQLHGLLKVATEGPCQQSHLLSIMPSSRAKWLAWQRLGSITREVAMEKYITLLSDNIPGWIADQNIHESKHPQLTSFSDLEPSNEKGGESNEKTGSGIRSSVAGISS